MLRKNLHTGLMVVYCTTPEMYSSVRKAEVIHPQPGYMFSGGWKPSASGGNRAGIRLISMKAGEGLGGSEMGANIKNLRMPWDDFIKGNYDHDKYPGAAKQLHSLVSQYGVGILGKKVPKVAAKDWKEPEDIIKWGAVGSDGTYVDITGSYKAWSPPPKSYQEAVLSHNKVLEEQRVAAQTHIQAWVNAASVLVKNAPKSCGVSGLKVFDYAIPNGWDQHDGREARITMTLDESLAAAVLEMVGIA